MAAQILGKALLALATQPAISSFVQGSPLLQPLVHRFVAGETLDDAMAVVRTLNAQGLAVALDFLGENTTSVPEAEAAAAEALRSLEAVASSGAQAYLSVKLTQLGLDLGEHVVVRNLRRLLEAARSRGLFVRIDMEGSTYTARTIEIFDSLLGTYEQVGMVIQAYLYRSERDIRELAAKGAQIRLVKGAYREPPHIAFRRKADTDRNFVRLATHLLAHGARPAIATHDPRMIEAVCAAADRAGVAREQFEFQMLYGIRRDLQEHLAGQGYRVRVYLPYGTQWYPYLTRRLAERPANMLFITRSLLRDGGAR